MADRPERFHLVDGVQIAWTEDDWIAWEAEQEASEKDFSFIRSNRDAKLRDSDWTQVADSPLTDEKKAEWVTYRQTLRDLTKNLPEDFDTLDGYAWPEQPS